MTAQRADRVLFCYRIGDPERDFPIYDEEGAGHYPGRWNTSASPLVYASEHFSTAMLEKLAHANGEMPANQHFVRITIPNGTSYEIFSEARHPGWDGTDDAICKAFGAAWIAELRSALLIVPSIPARIDRNFLINRRHPDASGITHSLPKPIWWDERLFG